MADYYIFEGPELEKLIENSLKKLGIKEEKAEIEILQEGQEGFLGMGKKNFKIKVIPLVPVKAKSGESKESVDDVVSGAQEKLEKADLKIDKTKQGIFLLTESGNKGSLEEVQKLIEENSIANVDYDSVKNFLEGDKDKVKIAEYDPDIYKDSEVFVEISSDKLEAYITITEPMGGNPLDFEEVVDIVSEEGVVFGIKENKINEILLDKKYGKKELVAEAKPAEPGEDARIEYKFQTKKELKPQLLENGKVDFKSLDLITNVVKGEVLGELVKETEGVPGSN
ncbi:MAG: flagellar assembly protein A, partial [Candidatus Muiribacteriota bacterium]